MLQVKLVVGKVVFTASVTSEIEQVSTLLPLSISTSLSSYTDRGICVGSKRDGRRGEESLAPGNGSHD